jgi:hypothetical protein
MAEEEEGIEEKPSAVSIFDASESNRLNPHFSVKKKSMEVGEIHRIDVVRVERLGTQVPTNSSINQFVCSREKEFPARVDAVNVWGGKD